MSSDNKPVPVPPPTRDAQQIDEARQRLKRQCSPLEGETTRKHELGDGDDAFGSTDAPITPPLRTD